MGPMVVREDCLKCHGHQGFKVGDVHGGVGVAVPMAPYQALQQEAVRTMAATHGGIWLLGLAGIGAISRRSWQRLVERERNLRELHLSAKVFENGLDGILITDCNGVIVRTNNAFAEITGYAAREAIGATPRILRSDHHRPAFYAEMWQTLVATGRWEGEIWNRRKGGEVFVVWQNMAAVRDAAGQVTHYIGSFRDITQQKEAEAHIQHLAHFDVLTDLPNRTLFQDRLGHAMERARREGHALAVLFLDLDRFKAVNDTLGHLKGDRLLQAVATRLHGCLRQGDTVARLGGDEFVLLLEDVTSAAEVQLAAEKVLAVFAQPVPLGEQELFIGASIGISLFPQDGDTSELLLRNADTAMYRAKEAGRNRLYFYDPAMSLAALERMAMENAMRHALVRDELFLAYQPQLDLRSGLVTGVEALVRWNHPQEGLLAPDRFIHLAEETGLILPLGQQVLYTACESAARWQRELQRPLRVAVNVSGRQLRDNDFIGQVRQALTATALDPKLLELELTESVLMQQSADAVGLLHELKGLGVSLSIDDFGTGYSSLAYLKHLPVDRLKIDRSFIRYAPTDAGDAAITETVITLGRSLGLEVVAEGVEERVHLDFVREHRCDLAQGNYLAEPLQRAEIGPFVGRFAA
jgi:diguanylate cyclase (GGDEF)-like protein/PAS domain S-box-containing protein